MLRKSANLYIKPYLHAFSPGVRASEKGFLYRNNNQNAHGRIASIQNSQRTYQEHRAYTMLLLPDQIIAAGIICVVSLVALILNYRDMVFTMGTAHTHRGFKNGMTCHEMFRRNDEMRTIFEGHKLRLEDGKEIAGERPDVFNAHGEYKSTSGRFVQEAPSA